MRPGGRRRRGILGTAVAQGASRNRHPDARGRACSRPSRASGWHQTGHSSGVIHAGIYYEPGSLKARLCVEGARALYDYCAERKIPHRRSGKFDRRRRREARSGRLDELERRGRANGVPGLHRLEPEEIAGVEPLRPRSCRASLPGHGHRRLRPGRGGLRFGRHRERGGASTPGTRVKGVEARRRPDRNQPFARCHLGVGGGLLRRGCGRTGWRSHAAPRPSRG